MGKSSDHTIELNAAWQLAQKLPDNIVWLDDSYKLIDKNTNDSLLDSHFIANKTYPSLTDTVFNIGNLTFKRVNLNLGDSKNHFFRIEPIIENGLDQQLKTTELALQKSEHEKSQILDSMIDGAALIGLDLKIKYANKNPPQKIF